MEALDITAFLSLVIGATQVIKDELGSRGMHLGIWARAVAFVLGGTGIYLMAYQPQLWTSLVPIFLIFGGTGGFSVVKEIKRAVPKPVNDTV